MSQLWTSTVITEDIVKTAVKMWKSRRNIRKYEIEPAILIQKEKI